MSARRRSIPAAAEPAALSPVAARALAFLEGVSVPLSPLPAAPAAGSSPVQSDLLVGQVLAAVEAAAGWPVLPSAVVDDLVAAACGLVDDLSLFGFGSSAAVLAHLSAFSDLLAAVARCSAGLAAGKI